MKSFRSFVVSCCAHWYTMAAENAADKRGGQSSHREYKMRKKQQENKQPVNKILGEFVACLVPPTQSPQFAVLNTWNPIWNILRIDYENLIAQNIKKKKNPIGIFGIADRRRSLSSLACIERSHRLVFHFNKILFIFWTHSLVSDITCNLCCRRHIIDVFASNDFAREHTHVAIGGKKQISKWPSFDMRNLFLDANFSPKIMLFA